MKINATVVYPVNVVMEISDEEYNKMNMNQMKRF